MRGLDNIKFSVVRYPEDASQSLVMKHRRLFEASEGDFDYYVYAEDDILITEATFDHWVAEQRQMPPGFACGVLRYEQKTGSDYKYLFDTHETHSVHRGGRTIFKDAYIINDKKYLEPYNIHQGCYMLTNDMLKRVLESGKYLEEGNHYVGLLEGGASDVYYKCGLTRVLPAQGIGQFLVHHSCNKYVHKLPDFYTEASTLNEVKWEALTK